MTSLSLIAASAVLVVGTYASRLGGLLTGAQESQEKLEEVGSGQRDAPGRRRVLDLAVVALLASVAATSVVTRDGVDAARASGVAACALLTLRHCPLPIAVITAAAVAAAVRVVLAWA